MFLSYFDFNHRGCFKPYKGVSSNELKLDKTEDSEYLFQTL